MLSLDLVRVLSPIELDDHTPIEADKIKVVGSERRLPPEMKALLPKAPQAGPKPTLLKRHGFA